jgi:prevent-host-death family protein
VNVSVRDLKDHLSEYLRRAEAGEEIMITSRGRPIARLAPPVVQPEDAEAEAIARLRAQPWIRPGTGGKPRGAENPVIIGPGEKTLSDIVSELRE